MIEIKKITVAELDGSPEFAGLQAEYIEEVKIDGMPPAKAQKTIYENLERAGVFNIFGAYLGDLLVGFVTVLVTVLPHFGVVMAVTESLFVGKDYRKTGAGLQLLKTAERHALVVGSPCLLVSAPVGGALADVLPYVGYTEKNRVFFRKLSDE